MNWQRSLREKEPVAAISESSPIRYWPRKRLRHPRVIECHHVHTVSSERVSGSLDRPCGRLEVVRQFGRHSGATGRRGGQWMVPDRRSPGELGGLDLAGADAALRQVAQRVCREAAVIGRTMVVFSDREIAWGKPDGLGVSSARAKHWRRRDMKADEVDLGSNVADNARRQCGRATNESSVRHRSRLLGRSRKPS